MGFHAAQNAYDCHRQDAKDAKDAKDDYAEGNDPAESVAVPFRPLLSVPPFLASLAPWR